MPILGAHVIVTKEINLSPHTIVLKDETGEVVRIDEGEVWIKLHKYHPGLSEWLNAIWLNDYTEDVADAIAYVDLMIAA